MSFYVIHLERKKKIHSNISNFDPERVFCGEFGERYSAMITDYLMPEIELVTSAISIRVFSHTSLLLPVEICKA